MLGGLGWPQVGLLLLLGLFLFGPDRLPGIAQEAGNNLRKLRVYLKGMTDELKTELGPEVGALDLRSLDPREFVRKHLFEDEPAPADAVPGRPLALRFGEPPPWDPDTT